jgi:hypothetical protein
MYLRFVRLVAGVIEGYRGRESHLVHYNLAREVGGGD